MGTVSTDAPALVDLGDCEDVFLSGLGKIERLPGNCIRFTWYVCETVGDVEQRTVKLKAVVPMEQLVGAIAEINFAIAKSGHPVVLQDGKMVPLN